MAERVTFVSIPPLALIFLVLGTIFLGVATPAPKAVPQWAPWAH
jgi:TRAP-type mannitol/chloroaromatic compound transport system permease large subunit